MSSTYLSPKTLYRTQQMIEAVKQYQIVFIVINLIAVVYIVLSVLKWSARKKESRKITNRFDADGEEHGLPVATAPVSVVFIVIIAAIDLFWLLINIL